MKLYFLFFCFLAIGQQQFFSQWFVSPDLESYEIIDFENSIGLEINHFRSQNISKLRLSVENESLIGKVVSIKLILQNGQDISSIVWDNFQIEEEGAFDRNLLVENVLTMKNSSKFFSSKKLTLIVNSEDTIYKSVLNMEGVEEIKQNLSSYIDFNDFTWRWNEDYCIYELGATLHNFSRMPTKNVNVMVTISKRSKVVYRKQHIIYADYQNTEVGPVTIRLTEPLCYINDLPNFGEDYQIEISTPEKVGSKLWRY